MRKPINGSPGLWTAANAEVLPPGALKQAKGCVIRRLGLIQKRRPYVQVAVGDDFGLQFFQGGVCEYNGNLYASMSQFKMYYATSLTPNAAWTLIGTNSRTFNCAAAVEINSVLYDGVQKIDADGTMPYAIGIPRALGPQATLVGAGTLLAATNSIGYRIVFGFLDAKKNLILGAPSGRVVATGTAAQNVSVKCFIPSAITTASNATSYFVQVYGTAVNTVASTDPGEEMQLKYQAFLTAADVGAGFTTFVDATPDTLRGAAGYFVPSQEGIAQANHRPPLAQTFALFKNTYFLGNTTSRHTANLQMTGVGADLLTISTAAGGITKSGGNGVYTFTGSPDLSGILTNGTAKLSAAGCTSAANNGEFVITAVNTGAFTITVTNAAAVTEAGLAGSRGWPSKLTIAAVNYYGSLNGTESAASQTFSVATAGSPQQNVTDTCASLLRVVNQQAAPVVYGYYESGPDDNAGKMSFTEVGIGGSGFSISASGTLLLNSFNPTIPVAAPLVSANDAQLNRLFMSKTNQPEHFPLANYFDIGQGTKKILLLVPLRDALLVFKQDGLFKVSGDGAGNFSVSPLDLTVQLITGSTGTGNASGQACSVMANRAYAVTNKGVLAISETSSQVVSHQVSDKFAAFVEFLTSSLVFSVLASERDGIVYFGVRDLSGVNTPVLQLAYCPATNAWTEAEAAETDPYISSELSFWAFAGFQASNGMLYRYNYVVQPLAEGHSLYREMNVEETNDIRGQVTVGAPLPADLFLLTVNSSTLTSASVTVFRDGYAGWQNLGIDRSLVGCALWDTTFQNAWLVTADNTSTYPTKVLTLSPLIGPCAVAMQTGRQYLMVPQASTIEWVPFTGGDDASYDRFREASITLGTASTATAATVSMYTEATTTTQTVNMTASNTPLPTGINTQSLIRALVPSNMQTARRLSVIFQHSNVAEYLFVRGISYEFDRQEGNEIT